MYKPDQPPLHRQLADTLRDRIRRGELQPGAPVPSEAELVLAFGISRGTVRQALAQLRSEGLIVGGRGRSPVVGRLPLAQPFAELLSFSAWARSMGMVASGCRVSLERRPTSPAIAALLDVRVGTPLVSMVRLRLGDGEPMLLERTVFAPGVGEAVEGLDLEADSIYAGLAARGITFAAAQQTIDAVGSTVLDATWLRVRRGAPLLRVRRRTTDPDGRPLEWADDRYRPDRVTLTIDQLANRPGIARVRS
jgi:GntR family transcriptional regulator